MTMAPMSGKASGGTFQLTGDTHNRASTLTYDPAGNLTYDGANTYAYDAGNMLKSAGQYSYLYDANGQRFQKLANGSIVKGYYYGSGSEPLAETDGSGHVTEEYIYLNGKRVARVDVPSNTTHYYLSDHLQSTSMVVNATTGAIEEESDYRPYGGEQVISGSGVNRYKFTGKERDSETNLDYFGARYYGSTMGRWLSADWAEGPSNVPYAMFTDPQTLNLYGYVRNNPLRTRDSDGHHCDPDSWDQKTHTLTGGKCYLDWWDLPGHAWAGFANLLTAQTPKQAATGARQMFYAYSVAVPFAQIGFGLGAADSLISLGLEAEEAGAVGEGAAVETGAKSVDVTKGNSVKNWKTDATPDQVGKTLENNGFTKSTTADGRIQYMKGDTECTMYPKAKTTGGPSMQVKVAGEVVSKVRMK
jgi:RHS repeat-associated protein